MNRSILLVSLCAVLLGGAVAGHAAVTADQAVAPDATTAAPETPLPPPPKTPKIKRILKDMHDASTRGHPDLFGEFAGMQHLFEGDYAQALKYFKIGARYADKLSQYSIAMMYFNGRGVAKDPATACAWLALAAQRKYPKFVRAHDAVCARLTPAQRDRATSVLAKLLPEYGDKNAKQRMKLILANDRRAVTGSHVGFDFGAISVPPGAIQGLPLASAKGGHRCSDIVMHVGAVNIPSSCGRYDPALLKPKTYFSARDAQFKATVTVGALQDTRTSGSSMDAKQSGTEATPASASSSGH